MRVSSPARPARSVPVSVSPRAGRWHILLVVVLAVSVYANILPNALVYDDLYVISNNPWIRDASHVKDILLSDVWGFSEDYRSHFYRPLHNLALIVLYAVSGANPIGYHVAGLLLHALASAGLYLVAREMFRPPTGRDDDGSIPLFAALIFAAHPIHGEAVAWASGFPDLSYGSFGLLFLFFHLRSRTGRGRGAATVFLFLALFSKEPAVALPFIAVVLDLFAPGDAAPPGGRLRRYMPYLVALAVYLAIRTYVLRGFAPLAAHPELHGTALVLNMVVVLAGYFRLLAFPIGQSVFHPLEPVASLLSARFALSAVAVLAYAAALAFFVRRRSPVSVGLLWCVLPLLPALYLPAMGENVMTERNLYMASAGFCLVAAVGLRTLPLGGRMPVRVIAGVLVAALALVTFERNAVWRDNISLWSDAVAKYPTAYVPLNNLGLAYETAGDFPNAEESFWRAATESPGRPGAHANLGVLYYKSDRYEKAVSSLDRALALADDPARRSFIAYNLGLTYRKLGQPALSIQAFTTAVELNPGYYKAYNSLGNSLLELGRVDEAIENYRTALSLRPGERTYAANLAVAIGRKNGAK